MSAAARALAPTLAAEDAPLVRSGRPTTTLRELLNGAAAALLAGQGYRSPPEHDFSRDPRGRGAGAYRLACIAFEKLIGARPDVAKLDQPWPFPAATVDDAAAQTAAFQQRTILERCSGRFWRTPEWLAQQTGLKERVVVRAINALVASHRLEQHPDSARFRATTAAPVPNLTEARR